MKSILIFLTAFLFVSGFDHSEQYQSEKLFKKKFFQIKRGTNISHWLSQSKKRGEERAGYFTAEDVAFLAEIGFDHIRIPIDEEQMWDEDGNKEEEAFKLLHNAIGWAFEKELKVIVDLHILRSHHFNNEEKPLWTDPKAQEGFFQCWRELSAELKKYPNENLAYELMNEPVADDPNDWNKLISKGIAIVRENEPERKIFIGSNRWQSTETFGDLVLPEDDKNIVVSFHFYEPFLVTHHQASWTKIGAYKGNVKYPGRTVEEKDLIGLSPEVIRAVTESNGYFDKAKLEERILKPVKFAKERGLQVYCGEWGCLPTVPRESFINWYSDVKSILEKHKIAWTTWDYKGGFGVRERDGKTPVNDLIEVLVGD